MKTLIKLILVVVLLAVAGVLLGLVYVDRIAKAGIEKGGTYALGVPTTLNSASVGVFTGEFGMSKLAVANPAGFKEPSLLALGEGDVKVSLPTLQQDVIELPLLKLDGIAMALERGDKGSNVGVILANLKRFETGESAPKDQPKDSAPGKKFVIKEVDIRNVEVKLAIAGLSLPTIKIDQIPLKNIGTAGEPVDLPTVISIIFKAIVQTATQIAGPALPGDVLGELQNGLGSLKSLESLGVSITADFGKAAEQFQQQVTGQLEKAGEQIKQGVDDAAKKLQEGLGGLLGGDKNKK